MDACCCHATEQKPEALMRATSSLLQKECEGLWNNRQEGRKEGATTNPSIFFNSPTRCPKRTTDCLIHLFLRLSRKFSVASIFSSISSFVLLIDFYHIPGSEQIFTNPTFNEFLPSNIKEI
jgi:hypothetical protein